MTLFINKLSQLRSRMPRWLNWLLDAALVILVVYALNSWLSRDMLASKNPAPQIDLPSLHSGDMKTVDWRGKDKTVLYFFAPWCSVCKISMPALQTLDDSKVQVMVIALDWKHRNEIRAFINDIGYNGEVLLGNQQTQSDYHIDAYPSYYVIDGNGEIIHRDRGLSTPVGLWLRTQ